MGELLKHAMTTLARESPDFKKALNVLLKYEIYTLLQRLSDNGEESVVITASVADGVKSQLGSRKGEDFLQNAHEFALLKERFLQFCGGNYSLTSQPANTSWNTSVNTSVNTTTNVSTNLPINPVANEPVVIKTGPTEPEPAEDPSSFHSPNKQSRLSPMENQTPSRQVRTSKQVVIPSSLCSISATEAGNYSLTSQPANTSSNTSVNTTANVSTNLPINPVPNEPVIKTEPVEPKPAEDPSCFPSPSKQSRLSPKENQTPSRQSRTSQQVVIPSSLSSIYATDAASKVALKGTPGRSESKEGEMDASWTTQQPGRSILNLPKSPRSEKTPKKKVHFMSPSTPGHHHGDHKDTYVEGHGDQSDSGIQGNRAMKVKALDFSLVCFESKPGIELDKAIEIEVSGETTSGKIAAGKSTSGKYTAVKYTSGKYTAVKSTSGKFTAGKSTSGKFTAGKSTSGKYIAGKSTSGKFTAGKSTSGKCIAGQYTSGKYTAGQSTSGKFTAGQSTSGKYTAGQSTSGKDTAGQSTSSKDTAGQSTSGPSTADKSAGHQSSSGKSAAEEQSDDFNTDEYVQQNDFVCPICSKSFKRKGYLTKHMKIHGEKKFACTMCDKAFVFSYGRRRHMVNAHRKEMSEHAWKPLPIFNNIMKPIIIN